MTKSGLKKPSGCVSEVVWWCSFSPLKTFHCFWVLTWAAVGREGQTFLISIYTCCQKHTVYTDFLPWGAWESLSVLLSIPTMGGSSPISWSKKPSQQLHAKRTILVPVESNKQGTLSTQERGIHRTFLSITTSINSLMIFQASFIQALGNRAVSQRLASKQE